MLDFLQLSMILVLDKYQNNTLRINHEQEKESPTPLPLLQSDVKISLKQFTLTKETSLPWTDEIITENKDQSHFMS